MIATMIAAHVPTASNDALLACHLCVLKFELSTQDTVHAILIAIHALRVVDLTSPVRGAFSVCIALLC